MSPEFDDLVDVTGLEPDEVRSLRQGARRCSSSAGPPAELPEKLLRAPLDTPLDTPQAPARRDRVPVPAPANRGDASLVAATVAAACFGGGYVVANQTHHSAIDVVRVVPMPGAAELVRVASGRLGRRRGQLAARADRHGLPKLQGEAHYVLMVWQDGKPVAICGTFEVAATGATTVRFSVPYRVTGSTRWVVTQLLPGARFPGHVVMTTS